MIIVQWTNEHEATMNTDEDEYIEHHISGLIFEAELYSIQQTCKRSNKQHEIGL